MKKIAWQAFGLVLLATVAAFASYRFHPRAPALYLTEAPLRDDEISLARIEEQWQGKVLWIDARPQAQYDQAHVPGARLLNEQDFSAQLLELLDELQTTDRPVVIYCGGEKCDASRRIREKLLGVVSLEHCYVLKGGWPAWKAAH